MGLQMAKFDVLQKWMKLTLISIFEIHTVGSLQIYSRGFIISILAKNSQVETLFLVSELLIVV